MNFQTSAQKRFIIEESNDKKYNPTKANINLFDDNGRILYNAGIKGSGMNTSIPKASILYSVDVIEGSNIISNIMETMSDSFH